MRRLSCCLGYVGCLAVAAACATSPRRATGSTTDSAAGAVGARTITEADLAGTWTARAYRSDVPNDPGMAYTHIRRRGASGQYESTEIFSNGQRIDQIPDRIVLAAGDSLVGEMGPWRGPDTGRDMITHYVARLRNGRVVGTYEIRVAGTDSVVQRGRFEGLTHTPE